MAGVMLLDLMFTLMSKATAMRTRLRVLTLRHSLDSCKLRPLVQQKALSYNRLALSMRKCSILSIKAFTHCLLR